MSEWRKCAIHPDVNGATMWGCPDCLAELRRRLGQINAISASIRATPFIKIGMLRGQLDQIAALSDLAPTSAEE